MTSFESADGDFEYRGLVIHHQILHKMTPDIGLIAQDYFVIIVDGKVVIYDTCKFAIMTKIDQLSVVDLSRLQLSKTKQFGD